MKNILNHLLEYKTLSKEEAKEVLKRITDDRYSQSHIVSFLTVFMLRKITIEELEGFRDALLDLCIRVELKEYETIDLCGTGGDGKNTFNISTLSSFVVAGAGAKVAKHGNYGVSSICGSSSVLEHLGLSFSNNEDLLKKQLEESNICFLHAPLFHPALKNVAVVRKELGVRTFFNMLGPLVNPVQPQKQITGVFSLELARLYSYLLQQSTTDYSIVYSLDRYDEVSLTGFFKVIKKESEDLFSPEDMGFKRISGDALYGGSTVKEAADIFIKVLNGEGTKQQNDVVLVNSALALKCYYKQLTIDECIEKARDSLFSRKAFSSFKKLILLS
ncbi:MAG: anthranilate phosphoribosyltransferase [Bacteroidota bacterium]|nr:anthranilate phosphoribosyltransferase [Bacteroidota bacterium]